MIICTLLWFWVKVQKIFASSCLRSCSPRHPAKSSLRIYPCLSAACRSVSLDVWHTQFLSTGHPSYLFRLWLIVQQQRDCVVWAVIFRTFTRAWIQSITECWLPPTGCQGFLQVASRSSFPWRGPWIFLYCEPAPSAGQCPRPADEELWTCAIGLHKKEAYSYPQCLVLFCWDSLLEAVPTNSIPAIV